MLSPIEYWKKLFTNEMFEMIAQQSTLYVVQNKAKCRISKADIEQLTGILMKMGVVPMPRYRMYWSREYRLDSIARRMSRDRFTDLLKNLHFNDNSKVMLDRENPGYDRLFKVRPLLNGFRDNCLKIENEEKQAIDEQIIPFKRKHKLKMYMPRKPHRWGFKVFSRCGVSTILYDFTFYEMCWPKVIRSTGFVPADFVIKLVENLPKNQNHKLYLDNYFNFIELQVRLKEEGIWTCGTMMANRMRGCPLMSEQSLKQAGRGSADFRTTRTGNVTAVAWFDSGRVLVTSTYLGVNPTKNIPRWDRKQKKKIVLPIPFIVAE